MNSKINNISILILDIIHQATRKESAADDKHLLEGDLEIIAKKAKELWDLTQKLNEPDTNSNNMLKFNLNDEICVQITDYGKNHIIEKYGQEFWDHVIEISKVTINNEDWYKMQAHKIPSFFGTAIWATSPAPIKSNILIS